MSLTVTEPTSYPITNKPNYEADTSLVEDSSHVNLRIRATLYVEGEVLSIIEQPKGLTKFDFKEDLYSICGQVKKPFKSTSKYFTPVSGTSNIIIGSWIAVQNFTWFTSADHNSFSYIGSGAGVSWVRSTPFSITKGDIFGLVLTAASNFSISPEIRLTKSTTVDTDIIGVIPAGNLGTGAKEQLALFMAKETATVYIWVGGINAPYPNFSASFNGGSRRITAADSEAFGRPAIHYKVEFQTYYEDSNGVTQSPSTEYKDTAVRVYAPIKCSATEFDTYILNASTNVFPTKSVGTINGDKITTYNPVNFTARVLGLSERAFEAQLNFRYNDAGGAMTSIFNHLGYFIVNIETESTDIEVSGVNSLEFQYFTTHGTSTNSVKMQIELSSMCLGSNVLLTFLGKLGYETIVLNGNKIRKKLISKETFTNEFGMDLPISSQYLENITVNTKFKSEDWFELFSELVSSTKTILMRIETTSGYDINYCVPVSISNKNILLFNPEKLESEDVNIIYWPYDEE